MTRGTAHAAAGALLALGLLAGSAPSGVGPVDPTTTAAPRLVAYDSCAEALADLRSAATAAVGPWGFGPGWRTGLDIAVPAGVAERAAAPDHSVTNAYEPDADEPDLVKTDGRRIVTVTGGVLRVVDPATRTVTGRLGLGPVEWTATGAGAGLLLRGDRALVLTRPAAPDAGPLTRPAPPGSAVSQPGAPVERPAGPAGPRLVLVDLAGAPRVLATYRIDGSLLDARLTGGTARVVVRTTPRLSFPYAEQGTDEERSAANRAVIARAGLDAWLPGFEWTAGTAHGSGRVGCDRVSRPATGSATTLVTVLSFDLGADRLGDGDPVGVAADADTVYGTAGSLYLAGRREDPVPATARGRWAAPTATDVHRFDLTGPGHPRYAATGRVPGAPLNQYALSEWRGDLRIATTTGEGNASESAVHVLRRRGDTLADVGRVGGLGRGERIQGVRFLGPTGYVVTFRRTDPLHTVDLADPTAPRVTGELEITGWSAYLHPLPDGRLLGVGQEADEQGRALGLQISLFDVTDPARPVRLARHHVPGAGSAAEFDPHAFLHQPATGLVALPVGAAVRLLRVSATGITQVGTVDHGPGRTVTRSLLVAGTLWTVSDAGLAATDPATARPLGWLPA
ncbi:beta-propeller domain-containing protein [Micromonospora sp. CPCC 205711]|uniref:beta-propeller domain-containing protein n=1 Tax=Micromonospora sp. CPCC 205547 TaxID=3122400 RepID=UPI002FF30BD6